MIIAVAIGLVGTIVALIGLLGRDWDGHARPAQIVVYALPLAIISGGYGASLGMTLPWAIVAAASVLVAVLAGGLMRGQRALSDQQTAPTAAGLSLALSGMVALGLAGIAVIWASQLIAAFSYLENHVVKLVLVLGAVALSIGGKSAVGLCRATLAFAILCAVVILGLGMLIGDPAAVSAPLVDFDPISPAGGITYAIGVVLIGAGYPVLRSVGEGTRGPVVVAAVVAALIAFAVSLGMLMLYGGSYTLPSLVINVFPVYTPDMIGAVICGLIAAAAIVVAGQGIRAAASYVAEVAPNWYAHAEAHPWPRRGTALVLGLVVLFVALLAPPATVMVLVLAVLAIGNLLAEWTIHRHRSKATRSDVSANDRSAKGQAQNSAATSSAI